MYHYRLPSKSRFRESISQCGQFRHAPADMFQELPPFLSITLDEFRTGQSDGLT